MVTLFAEDEVTKDEIEGLGEDGGDAVHDGVWGEGAADAQQWSHINSRNLAILQTSLCIFQEVRSAALGTNVRSVVDVEE